jgi:hypothetical protein
MADFSWGIHWDSQIEPKMSVRGRNEAISSTHAGVTVGSLTSIGFMAR